MDASSRAPILIVDDDPAVRELLQAALESLGFRVVRAGSATEAEELLRTGVYSLVLSDFEMPGKTGLDLLAVVSEIYPDVPFLLLTGHGEIDLARRAIRSGAADFLSKPFSQSELARLVEQGWERMDRDHRRAEELTAEILTGTVRALVAAVDAKDPHTASHSERVTRLVARLGTTMGLPPGRLRTLEFASLLHDTGKIRVPERILTKPGPLDADERSVIEMHPVWSAQIVMQVEALRNVVSIVRHHHERWDGKGYPDKLSGDVIPELARMIAVADVYEALTSNRSYRPAMTHEAALRILRDGRGSQFDAGMTDAFLSLTDYT